MRRAEWGRVAIVSLDIPPQFYYNNKDMEGTADRRDFHDA